MVFDAIAAEPHLLAEVDRLTSAGYLQLLAAAETMIEIAATPEPAHRRQLERVRVLVVAPVDDQAPVVTELLTRLRRSTGVSDEDARIAAAAEAQGVALVTEDRDLRAAVAADLPHVATWTWEADLRPRIVTLGNQRPGPSRSR
jgi:predicted nucleic acid-binding protein